MFDNSRFKNNPGLLCLVNPDHVANRISLSMLPSEKIIQFPAQYKEKKGNVFAGPELSGSLGMIIKETRGTIHVFVSYVNV